MPDFKNVSVEVSLTYKYSLEHGLKCKICDACSSFKTNTANKYQYATGKQWEARKLVGVNILEFFYGANLFLELTRPFILRTLSKLSVETLKPWVKI